MNLICSWLHRECHSKLLVFSPSIWILPHFQDSLAVLIFWLYPEFWWQDMIICFVFSAFISRPASLLAPKSVSCSLLLYLYYCPTN
jgi:hypothetical protein